MVFIAATLLIASVVFLRERTRIGPRAEVTSRVQIERLVGGLTARTIGRLVPIALLAAAVVVLGLYVGRRIETQSDPERFIPQDSQVLADLHYVRDVTGSTSELNLLIELEPRGGGPATVVDDEVLAWMISYQDRLRATEGVEIVSHQSWFGGVYQDPSNFFAQMVVEPEPFMKIYPEFTISPEHVKAWLDNRRGAIVGEIERDPDPVSRNDHLGGDIDRFRCLPVGTRHGFFELDFHRQRAVSLRRDRLRTEGEKRGDRQTIPYLARHSRLLWSSRTLAHQAGQG